MNTIDTITVWMKQANAAALAAKPRSKAKREALRRFYELKDLLAGEFGGDILAADKHWIIALNGPQSAITEFWA